MRIFTEHRIENRLAAGNKGILTNGEKRKSALSCLFSLTHALFIEGWQLEGVKRKPSKIKGCAFSAG